MLMPISLGLNSNPGRTAAAGSARLLNCYAERAGTEQKAEWQIWAADGLSLFATLPTGPVRAKLEVDGVLYVVAGKRIYAVQPSGAYTDIGGIATTGPVYMARNRRPVPQIAVVSSGLYVVIEGGVAKGAWPPNLIPPTSVAFSDGYFVFSHEDGRISHTESDDALTVDGLAFASAESNPDKIVRNVGLQSFVLPFGVRSIEWWQDVGGDPFAFERNFAIQIGCAAAGSVAEIEQTIMWIADDLTVRIMQGHQAAKVSDHAVERAIASEANVAGIVAVTWRSRGHSFYAISGTAWTWVYDLLTGKWHNRESYGLGRWRVSTVTEFGNSPIAGDYASGKLYRMGPDYLDEAGSPIVVEIVTPPVHTWPARMSIAAFYLDMIPGVGVSNYVSAGRNILMWGTRTLLWGTSILTWGTSAEAGDIPAGNPHVMLAMSKDGGYTWSTEHRREIGRQGEYQRRIVWRRLGATKQAGVVFRVRASASVMRGFLGAAVDAEKLAA